jgi:hypothetical protein
MLFQLPLYHTDYRVALGGSGVQVFELSDLVEVILMPPSTAKNWTSGKPVRLEPSIRPASGTGSRNLFSREDLDRMALAWELSKSGMAAKAIARALGSLKDLPLGDVEALTLWREAGGLDFKVHRGATPPKRAVVWHIINVAALMTRINEAVRRREQERMGG